MLSVNKIMQAYSLIVAALMILFICSSTCSPIHPPSILQFDEGHLDTELQEELKLKHVTSPFTKSPEFVHKGDMTIFQDERPKRNAVNSPKALWPEGIVPYEISPTGYSDADRQIILRAMQHWENHTCIRFRPKVSSDIYSIYIYRDGGCASFVGRLHQYYQPQGVSLGYGCVYSGVVVHELGHAIGFFHEHTRPDRDQYIDVIYDSIAEGFKDQFTKFKPGETNTLGLPYDIQSIMHYGWNTFSKDGSDTIQPKDKSVTSFGTSNDLSPLDIAKARKLYTCDSPAVNVSKCGSNFTSSNGTLQTPNWPHTYPVNIDCEWFIELPNKRATVEITCNEDPYGIAGVYPQCEKDYLVIYNGHSNQDSKFGPYCEWTKPGVVKTETNLAKVVFHAGSQHSPSRVGLKCRFQSVVPPPPPTTKPPILPLTTQPPQTTQSPSTTTQTTESPTNPLPCGGVLNAISGSFQTPNWPATYPVNVDCQWTIELPDASNAVELKCDYKPFGIAGSYPDCNRDYLKFYDGHSTQNRSYGPYCHFTPPSTIKMSSNKAMVVFHAGPSHSPSRVGFKCTFQSLPLLSQCGGVLTASSGSLRSQNWPDTYPVNMDCEWKIVLPNTNRRVELTFETPFGIAGSLPDCVKDHLRILDDRAGTTYGPYCYFTQPPRLTMSSNEAKVIFHAGPAHNPSRVGFKANYRSV